jgi:hypothetical protein
MSKLPLTLKSYVGRIFALRRRAKITASFSQKDGNSAEYPREEFGDAVLVLDETNAKVKVLKNDGFVVWIPKYFLLKEIPTQQEPELTAVLETVRNMALKLQGKLTEEEQESVAKAMAAIRALLDKNDPS